MKKINKVKLDCFFTDKLHQTFWGEDFAKLSFAADYSLSLSLYLGEREGPWLMYTKYGLIRRQWTIGRQDGSVIYRDEHRTGSDILPRPPRPPTSRTGHGLVQDTSSHGQHWTSGQGVSTINCTAFTGHTRMCPLNSFSRTGVFCKEFCVESLIPRSRLTLLLFDLYSIFVCFVLSLTAWRRKVFAFS